MKFEYGKSSAAIGIYEIYNSLRECSYIGQTSRQFGIRWNEHKKYLLNPITEGARGKTNILLKNSFLKCFEEQGNDNFIEFRILEIVEDKSKLDEREIFWIAKFKEQGKKLYNFQEGGQKGWTENTSQKISEAKKGFTHSEETKQKISESKQGHTPWNKGLTNPYSEETIKQMSESAKGKTGESNPFFGKRHTEGSIEKNRQAHLGKTAWNKGVSFSEESRKKMSEAKKGKPGRPISDEEKRNLSESRKGNKAGAKTFFVNITSPNGIQYDKIDCMADFCIEHKLNLQTFKYFLKKPHILEFKGWIKNIPMNNGVPSPTLPTHATLL